jgi:hypothetical protein
MPNQRAAEKVAITVYVPLTLKAAAKTRAEEKGETVTDVIVRALRRYTR